MKEILSEDNVINMKIVFFLWIFFGRPKPGDFVCVCVGGVFPLKGPSTNFLSRLNHIFRIDNGAWLVSGGTSILYHLFLSLKVPSYSRNLEGQNQMI